MSLSQASIGKWYSDPTPHLKPARNGIGKYFGVVATQSEIKEAREIVAGKKKITGTTHAGTLSNGLVLKRANDMSIVAATAKQIRDSIPLSSAKRKEAERLQPEIDFNYEDVPTKKRRLGI